MRQILKNTFGFEEFRDGQEQVISSLLDGRPVLAVFPTGGGKSMCYQLPALMLDGLTLVISPLIALMKDQVDALKAKGVGAARLDSSLEQSEYQEVMAGLKSGDIKLLYVAPERLANEGFRRQLNRLKVDMVAIDEAHCISEWGHNFRPDYLKLAKLFRDMGIQRVLCLTATATPGVSEDIRREFEIDDEDEVRLSFHRANLDLRVLPVAAADRNELLLQRLGEHEGAVVVYVTLQQTAESVATFLKKNGVSAQAYHAGLPAEFREEAQEKFMRGEIRVMVATIAFGMGVDKSDIRAVFHYNLPKSIENYSQETGRAGRDGLPSVCEMLACGDDLVTLENFVHGDTPTPQAMRNLVDHVLRLGSDFDVSVYELSTINDIRPLVVTTLLTYLELEEVIVATRPFYASYSVKLVRDFEQVLAGYDDQRKDFLRRTFAAAKEGRSWLTFDLDEVALATGETRDRIVAALTHLEEAGDLALRKSKVRQGYRLLKEDVDLKHLAKKLDERFQKREDADLQRVRQVVALAESSDCLTHFVTHHFGEEIGECGHCDRCRGVEPQPLPRSPVQDIDVATMEIIQQLDEEGHASLKTNRQVARFLCGISSPAASRARLTRHDQFGLLEAIPFEAVLSALELRE